MHMQTVESKALLPTRREIVARIFRQKTAFVVCFLVVVAGFVLTGQFSKKYKADMKILVRKDRVDPVLTPSQNSTPDLLALTVSEEDLNSEVELLKGEDLLRDVVLHSGLVPEGTQDPIVIAKGLKKLQRNLDISAVAKTDLISISYQSPNPEESLRVVKTLESLYPMKQQSVKGNDFQITFFTQQLVEKRRALEVASRNLTDFTSRTHIVSAGLQRDLSVRQMADLDQELQQTSADVANLQGRRATLINQIGNEKARITTETRASDNPQLLQQLKANLLDLQLKRTELLNEYDANYRAVKDIDREIKNAQDFIDQQESQKLSEVSENVNPIHQTLQTELYDVNAQLDGLQKKRAQLRTSESSLEQAAANYAAVDPDQQILLQNLKNAQDQFQLFEDKLAQAQMTHSLDTKGFLNVVVAQEPITPALPQHSLIAVVGEMLFAGLLLSIGCAFLFDVFDPTVRTITELREVSSAPILGEFGSDIHFERGSL
jgi:polysaccharide biosynthesis transport protein